MKSKKIKEEIKQLKYEAKKLLLKNNLDGAEITYKKILKLNKEEDVIVNLIWILIEKNKIEEADNLIVENFKEDNADICYFLGIINYKKNKEEEAKGYFLKAISINKNFFLAYRDLINLYINTKNIDEAEKILIKAKDNFPGDKKVLDLCLFFYEKIKFDAENLMKIYSYIFDISDDKKIICSNIREIANKIENPKISFNLLNKFIKDKLDRVESSEELVKLKLSLLSSMIFLYSYDENFSYEQEKIYIDLYKETLSFIPKKKNNFNYLNKNDKIKIGFISSALNNSPTSLLLMNLLKNINKEMFEVVVINITKKNKFDKYTEKIKNLVLEKNYIENKIEESYSNFIGRLFDLNLNVLIELDGYLSYNTLNLLHNRIAPIQISWLGYWGYHGVEEIDYILLDKYSIEEKDEIFFENKVKHIKDTRLNLYCEDRDLKEIPYFKNKYITFGCVQNLKKINDETISCWAEILNKVENSILLIRSMGFEYEEIKAEFFKRVTKLGINEKQIKLEKPLGFENYMDSFLDFDILLDTFPFNGATTTMQALYMGVPTVTRFGNSIQSRQGRAILLNLGLDDWIAKNSQEYINKSIEKAKNIDELSFLRNTLRDKFMSSAIGDGAIFARNFEKVIKELL